MSQMSLLEQIAELSGSASPSRKLPTGARPVIAVPTTAFTNLYGNWQMQGVEQDIGNSLAAAGADAWYFPCRPLKGKESAFLTIWRVLRRADGLLIPGGVSDVLPGWFIKSPESVVGTASWWEDWWRWHLTQMAVLLCMPFLGIDLGADYLNVVLGGTLYSDIHIANRRFARHLAGKRMDANRWIFTPLDVLLPESRLARCVQGNLPVWTACMHRVAVADVAPDLVVSARSGEGCAEVLERADAFFGVATQGHPEQGDVYANQPYARNLFALFGECALQYASSRRDELEEQRGAIEAYLHSAACPRLLLRSPAAAAPAGEHVGAERAHTPQRA